MTSPTYSADIMIKKEEKKMEKSKNVRISKTWPLFKVVLIRLGIYLFVNKARGAGEGAPNFLFLLCDVTTI